MKAAPFSYVRATSLAEAFRLWSDAGPEAKLLAGGQSLLASLAFRLSEPGALIDISRVPELAGIAQAGEAIRIGAAVTQAELGRNELVRRHLPLLAEAVPLIAHPAIRNRGTVGGSLAFADPAAELPACAVALDAVVIARSAEAERRIPAGQVLHRPLRDRARAQRADRGGGVPRRQGGRAQHDPGAGAPLRRLRHRRGGGQDQGRRQHPDRPALRVLRRRRPARRRGTRDGRHRRQAGAGRDRRRRPGRARHGPRSDGRSARRPRR